MLLSPPGNPPQSLAGWRHQEGHRLPSGSPSAVANESGLRTPTEPGDLGVFTLVQRVEDLAILFAGSARFSDLAWPRAWPRRIRGRGLWRVGWRRACLRQQRLQEGGQCGWFLMYYVNWWTVNKAQFQFWKSSRYSSGLSSFRTDKNGFWMPNSDNSYEETEIEILVKN